MMCKKLQIDLCPWCLKPDPEGYRAEYTIKGILCWIDFYRDKIEKIDDYKITIINALDNIIKTWPGDDNKVGREKRIVYLKTTVKQYFPQYSNIIDNYLLLK